MIMQYFHLKKTERLISLLNRKGENARILVVRNDGLGDFILTLPLITSLKNAFPSAKIYALIHKRVHNLVPALPDITGCIIDEGILLRRDTKSKDVLAVKTARESLRKELMVYQFDLAIVVYGEAATANLVKSAKIPWRMGTSRRWYSFRYNLWNSDSRKRSNRSEYNLNLAFLKYLNLRHGYSGVNFRLPPGTIPPVVSGEYIVVHPYKRSGTALVWPIQNFRALAEYFLAQKKQVVILGDTGDDEILRKYFSNLRKVHILTGMSLLQSTRIIAGARHFFGNSSGPLHLCGLTKTPHTAVFPQNNASSAARWRTLPFEPSPPEKKQFLLQTSFPMKCRVCIGSRCSYYPCTEKITMEQMIESYLAWQKISSTQNNSEAKSGVKKQLKKLGKIKAKKKP